MSQQQPFACRMREVHFIRSLIVLHRAFGRRDARTRIHALLRFLSCPFQRVLRHLPSGGRLLDIGCGHGVFVVLAATRGTRATGVDPDQRKIRRTSGVQMIAGYDEAVRGTFDAVSIIDVLYKIPIEAWDPLLLRARERLAAGGVLLIKEQDPTARIKNSWNAVQEWIAARLGLTLGKAFSYEAPAVFATRLERLGFRDIRVIPVGSGYPHPHVLYTARR
jgi:2-polyprenyl-3-methyl-5-hydroxy-6-metoxy-1,4-benzoquinol methylase